MVAGRISEWKGRRGERLDPTPAVDVHSSNMHGSPTSSIDIVHRNTQIFLSSASSRGEESTATDDAQR